MHFSSTPLLAHTSSPSPKHDSAGGGDRRRSGRPQGISSSSPVVVRAQHPDRAPQPIDPFAARWFRASAQTTVSEQTDERMIGLDSRPPFGYICMQRNVAITPLDRLCSACAVSELGFLAAGGSIGVLGRGGVGRSGCWAGLSLYCALVFVGRLIFGDGLCGMAGDSWLASS
jgi:hypothetical protein